MTKRFIDGTPVPPDYEAEIRPILTAACEAEEMFTLDELEEHARKPHATCTPEIAGLLDPDGALQRAGLLTVEGGIVMLYPKEGS